MSKSNSEEHILTLIVLLRLLSVRQLVVNNATSQHLILTLKRKIVQTLNI
jgi:hypothetical protein